MLTPTTQAMLRNKLTASGQTRQHPFENSSGLVAGRPVGPDMPLVKQLNGLSNSEPRG